ncbi:MAG: hypothetical protein K0S53_185 [Bacteroidetes bacterium]|jgi:hypothetical protein|nr:hypothetical protein [Bacteroidota bacterium]MDF2452676.1 hypothetical protein [Bacteroidota bacterium]
MKKLNLTLIALSLCALISCNNADKKHETETTHSDTVATTAPEHEPITDEPDMDSTAMAKAWEQYMTPGSMHQVMTEQNGKWKGELVSWMKADAPPTPASEVTAENKMILGGRYQESIYKGKMMGMDFEGHGIMAYDNAKKVFINTWIDNMGTGVMYMEGPYDEATKTITMKGKMTDPATGKEIEMRQVVKTIDDKNQVMEMYCTEKGKEFKNMEIKLTKK